MGGVDLLPRCYCGSMGGSEGVDHGLPVIECPCGTTRQRVPMTTAEYHDWYSGTYLDECYTHDYDHDRDVAAKRVGAYGLHPGQRVLDIGSGLGAFVDECRSRGIEAVGVEPGERGAGEHVYTEELHDACFPTDAFDVIALHDVLEHLVDPLAVLAEVARIVGPNGVVWIDFPRFHHPTGRHHWKPVEHLWMLDEEQLVELVERAGFRARSVSHPVPSKVLVEAHPVPACRPTIMVPSGIGDSYWVMVKLRAFLEREGLGLPDIYIQDGGGPKRTEPFVQTIPFVHAAGYRKAPFSDPVFEEAYLRDGRTIFRDVLGVDYFIAYNGVMRFGQSLEEADPDLACEWYPPMHRSLEARRFAKELASDGPYLVAYFVDSGMYKHWLADFGPDAIGESLEQVQRETGLRIVLTGAEWDEGSTGTALARRDPSWVDLIGETSFNQMVGLLAGASVIYGWPAGNTILGSVLGTPAALVWNDYFDRRFWRHACPPDAPVTVLDSAGLTAEAAARAVIERLT